MNYTMADVKEFLHNLVYKSYPICASCLFLDHTYRQDPEYSNAIMVGDVRPDVTDLGPRVSLNCERVLLGTDGDIVGIGNYPTRRYLEYMAREVYDMVHPNYNELPNGELQGNFVLQMSL